jgi:hypothetical protein
MTECEHELIAIDEYWMGENYLQVTMECQKCKKKFRGIIYEEMS